MNRVFVLTLSLFICLFFSCKKEIYWDTADIVGFDPCTGAYTDSLDKGYVIITLESKDTLLTYNLPPNIFTFPKSFFANYKNNFLFPDSVRYKYRVRIKYSFTEDNRKIASFCFGDIYQGDFIDYTKNRQITLHSARKY